MKISKKIKLKIKEKAKELDIKVSFIGRFMRVKRNSNLSNWKKFYLFIVDILFSRAKDLYNLDVK
jgi:hypothetical protein